MKAYILINIVLLVALFSNQVIGQELNDQKDKENYVVLTKKIPQLAPIFLTAESLAIEDGDDFGKFEVIICGQTVEELTNKKMMQDYIDKAKNANVELVICGFSMKKFGVSREDISKELRIVENGILYNIQLQKKGYTSISI